MLNQSLRKKSNLLKMLGKVKPRSKYYLYIATCYFKTDAADNLIKAVRAQFPIEDVYIYIDRKSALAIGKEALQTWVVKYGDQVGVYPISHSSLFHSKGYALISFDKNENIVSGSLVIGSANLTGSGLVRNKGGNIETLIDTQDKKVLEEWIIGLEDLNWMELEDLEDFSSAGDIDFQYAMLQEGEFIHPWSGDLRSLLAVKYSLNEKGKRLTKTPEVLSGVGFDLDAASISKSYIEDFSARDYLSDEFNNLKRNYGIECRLGYWIPKNVFDRLFKKGRGFEAFKGDLEDYCKARGNSICESIRAEYSILLRDGVIDRVSYDPAEGFLEKFRDLLRDDEKLMRLYSRLARYEMPYGIEDSVGISSLFEEILQTAEGKKKKNMGQRAWLDGVEGLSLQSLRDSLDLDEDW